MRRAERKHEWLICCGEVSLTAPQKRNHPAGGFFFCVHFTPQSRLRLDGRSVSGLLLFTSTPQSIRLAAYCQLPGRGVFGRYTQTLVQSRRAANDGPYSTSYKPLAKTRGRTASTISSQSLTLTRRKADFTLRKQYFTARQRNFTRSQERISPRAEARYISLSSASPYSL